MKGKMNEGHLWRTLLCALLVAALLMMAVTAEEQPELEVSIDEEITEAAGSVTVGDNDAGDEEEISIEIADDALILDEIALSGPDASGILADGALADGDGMEETTDVVKSNESKPEDFEIDKNGVLVKYVGPGGDVVIPDGVTGIGKGAFLRCESLTSVTIPGSVVFIDDGEFENDDGTTPQGAFYACPHLVSVTIGNGVKSIGTGTFSTCTNLKSVTIPDSVTSIGEYAFYSCNSLTNIDIPNSVTSIGKDAFSNCQGLTNIHIPNSVRSIDNYTFFFCPSLRSVTLPEGLTSIGKGAFQDCYSLTNISIPNGVTSIGDSAFYDCKSLTSISIPDSVKIFDYDTFSGCESLSEVIFNGIVTYIGRYAFYGCSSLTSIIIPDGIFDIDSYAFSGCLNLKSVSIGASIPSYTIIETYSPDEWAEAFASIADQIIIKLYFPGHPIEEGAFINCHSDIVFYTRCETEPTIRLRKMGFNVVTSDHVPIVLPGRAATCSEYGLTEGEYCLYCRSILKEQEYIPCTDHTPVVDPAVEPTYTSTGLTEGSHCAVCGEVIVAQTVIPAKIGPTKVKLSKKNANLGVKEELTLKVTLKPANADKTLSWKSSKPKTASVDQNGVVTAKEVGETKITVTAPNGKNATATITVKPSPKTLTLNKKGTVTLKKGNKLKLKATITKGSASALTWRSSNSGVASVNDKGMVTALKKGTATITVRTFNGLKAKVKVMVK